MKILITAPSLDENRNVSGISTVARQIVENGTFRYAHFAAGREDREKTSARWILKQGALPFRFFRAVKNGNFDIVHINTAFNALSIVRDFALVRAARLAKTPVLLHVHGGRYLAENFANKKLESLAKKMLRASDSVIVLSELEKDIIEKRWKNIKVEVLENAVAPGIAPLREKTPGEKTIIYLGRLTESKGLREITKACRALKNENFNFRFDAYGAGDLQDFFVGEMKEILGDKFRFGGIASGAEKRRALARADIFVLPSRYGEGLPVAMLEAMATGCAVVVSEMASIGAVVRDGFNGFTIEPGDVSQLIEKLRILLSGAIDLREIGKNARKTVEEKFDLRDYIVRLENIYKEIIDKKSL